jgi:hypothetical protein
MSAESHNPGHRSEEISEPVVSEAEAYDCFDAVGFVAALKRIKREAVAPGETEDQRLARQQRMIHNLKVILDEYGINIKRENAPAPFCGIPFLYGEKQKPVALGNDILVKKLNDLANDNLLRGCAEDLNGWIGYDMFPEHREKLNELFADTN